ncbi:hypothetical protein ACGFJT_37085 [Actinomadura geliboluensis]|uniref:hypothetical protein n=1 Tax=Actinomadura geliboluensis TaxID=882440 RepID=UPI003714E19D
MADQTHRDVRVGKWLRSPKAAPRAPAEASVSDEGSQGWARVADLPTQWLAEVLWTTYRRAHGYSALHPLAETRPDVQAQYRRFAREVAERIDQMRATAEHGDQGLKDEVKPRREDLNAERDPWAASPVQVPSPDEEPDCDGPGDRRDQAAQANTEETET